jgi:hypothetical protein
MKFITPLPPNLPPLKRAFLSIPVIGWMARDVLYGDRENILWAMVILASLWIAGVATWGIFVLLIPFTLAIPAALYLWLAYLISKV